MLNSPHEVGEEALADVDLVVVRKAGWPTGKIVVEYY